MSVSAERIDPVTGCREVAEFVSAGDDLMYVVSHLPAASACSGAIVICSPFFAEFARNYRREVLLARHLAELGVAVARFHHRGVGNSTGDAALTRLDRLVDDAKRVAAVVIERSGAGSLGFHGTRLAAFTAVGAASSEHAVVSLWDPVATGSRYFNEVFRARMAQAVHDGESGLTAGLLRDQLAAGQAIDVMGHSLYPRFYTSLAGRRLIDDLGGDGGDALIIEFGRPQTALDELFDRLRELGIKARRATTSESESWWVANRRADYFVAEEQRSLTSELLADGRDWVKRLGWLQ